jgi:hypothetical protein
MAVGSPTALSFSILIRSVQFRNIRPLLPCVRDQAAGRGGNLPARRADLQRLMRTNGYSDISVYAPAGFTRPLLVGRPERAAA